MCRKTKSFLFLKTTQDLSKIKKPQTVFCTRWWVGSVCEVSEKILISMVVGAHQSFQVSRIQEGAFKADL